MMMNAATLYAIVDPARCSPGTDGVDPDAVEQFTRAVIDGGAGFIQLRDKTQTARQTYHLACRLADVCAELDVLFIVNDRLDIALAAGADGVHVGPEDVPVAAIRDFVDDEFIIGGSAGTPEVARRLEEQGADYLGVGAVYEARNSKPDASSPRGPEAVASVVDAVDIPVVGIGGIDASNAAAVTDSGAHGVAVISALSGADDPRAAAAELCAVMTQ